MGAPAAAPAESFGRRVATLARMSTPGPLALVGGDELKAGNEPQDRLLAEAAGVGPAYVLATAAAGQRPDLAVRHAIGWFSPLGLDVEELPATSRALVESPEIAERARGGRFFYLVGGDPRLVVATLAGSPVWEAITAAWREGAALAGASAGAMALCQWALLPGSDGQGYSTALDLVPLTAVLPHFDTFGNGWVERALAAIPDGGVTLVGPDERTAAVWQAGTWRAMGEGGVTVLAAGSRERFTEGAAISGLPQPRA